MISTINANAGAHRQLSAFRAAKSDVRMSAGGVFGGLMTRLQERVTADPTGRVTQDRNRAAWSALTKILDKTHGRSGTLAMRAMRDACTEGKPLSPDRIRSVLSRADAYAAAERLLQVKAAGQRPLTEAQIERAVTGLRSACEKAIAANPDNEGELSPQAVIDSIIRDLPASQIKGLRLCEGMSEASDKMFDPSRDQSSFDAEWRLNDEAGGLVEFARQDLLRQKFEKSPGVEMIPASTTAKQIGRGANGKAFKVDLHGKPHVFKPMVLQTITGASIAGETRFSVEGAQSAARAVASDRVAELFGFDELVKTQFALRETNDGKRHFGVLMETAEQSHSVNSHHQRNHAAIDKARPALARLQMMDWICGQTDRHLGNITVDPKAGTVKAFDNDDAFTSGTKAGIASGKSILAPPPVIDTAMRDKLDSLALNPNLLRNRLGDILDPASIKAAETRLEMMRQDVAGGKILVIEADAWPMDGNIDALQQQLKKALDEHPAENKAKMSDDANRPPINKRNSYPELYHAAVDRVMFLPFSSEMYVHPQPTGPAVAPAAGGPEADPAPSGDTPSGQAG